jgi:hypothetical protein
MDIQIVYGMAKAAARGSQRALEAGSDKATRSFETYGGYPAYVSEYNRLLRYVFESFGDEAQSLFQPIDLGKSINPADAIPMMWRTYLELASARLNALVVYLQTKLGTSDKETEIVFDMIEANLRPGIFKDPQREDDVQDVLEIIFRARGLDYRREKVTIEYSSKLFVPDFTFESLDLVVEVKLCKSESKEKVIVDEINADIPAYQTKYARVIFVVYDLGFIRDVDQFRSGIESNPNVRVLVVKK